MTATSTANAPLIDPAVVRLVDRAQTGDQTAFAELYDRYVDDIYAYVRRRVRSTDTAEDLVGDVFLRAWRRIDTFEWQGVDIGAWLVTIARNRVYDHYKSSKTRLEQTTDVFPDRIHDTVPTDSPERIAMGRDMARSLGQALERLNPDHREVIELRFVHEYGVAETAAAMDRTVGATKALQYRALRALAALVKDDPGLGQFVAAGIGSLVILLRALG